MKSASDLTSESAGWGWEHLRQLHTGCPQRRPLPSALHPARRASNFPSSLTAWKKYPRESKLISYKMHIPVTQAATSGSGIYLPRFTHGETEALKTNLACSSSTER